MDTWYAAHTCVGVLAQVSVYNIAKGLTIGIPLKVYMWRPWRRRLIGVGVICGGIVLPWRSVDVGVLWCSVRVIRIICWTLSIWRVVIVAVVIIRVHHLDVR